MTRKKDWVLSKNGVRIALRRLIKVLETIFCDKQEKFSAFKTWSFVTLKYTSKNINTLLSSKVFDCTERMCLKFKQFIQKIYIQYSFPPINHLLTTSKTPTWICPYPPSTPLKLPPTTTQPHSNHTPAPPQPHSNYTPAPPQPHSDPTPSPPQLKMHNPNPTPFWKCPDSILLFFFLHHLLLFIFTSKSPKNNIFARKHFLFSNPEIPPKTTFFDPISAPSWRSKLTVVALRWGQIGTSLFFWALSLNFYLRTKKNFLKFFLCFRVK